MTVGSLITALGYLTGAILFYITARKRTLATEGMAAVALAGLVGGVVGARLTEWLLVHFATWQAQPAAILNPQLGGRTIIGGILCGWLAVEFTKWRLGIRRSTGDMFALALPAGEAVGRFGCLLNGCCYGTTTSVTWAIYQHGAWRHPAQIYSAIAAIVVFIALLAAQHRVRREGDLFRLYLVLYGASRFAIEFFRDRHLAFAGLSLAQLTCIEVAIAGGIGLWLVQQQSRKLSLQQG
jgi:phosphatidylglycerol:prolipoprotein diacylglycerol transferase